MHEHNAFARVYLSRTVNRHLLDPTINDFAFRCSKVVEQEINKFEEECTKSTGGKKTNDVEYKVIALLLTTSAMLQTSSYMSAVAMANRYCNEYLDQQLTSTIVEHLNELMAAIRADVVEAMTTPDVTQLITPQQLRDMKK